MYIEYLTAQKERVNKCHTCVEGTITGAPIDLFLIQKLKQFCGTNDNFSSSFSKICSAIETFGVYKPILLNDFFVSYSRLEFSRTIYKLSEKGFPCIYQEYEHVFNKNTTRCHLMGHTEDSILSGSSHVVTIRQPNCSNLLMQFVIPEESTTTEQPSVKLSTSFIDWEL